MVFALCQLHLRRVGVEPRPDLVPGISRGGGGSSSEEKEKKDEKKDPEDPPKDDRGNPDNPFAETQLPPAPESSESRNSSDDQLVSNAKFCHVGNEDMMVSLPSGFLNKQDAIATEFVMRLSWEIFALHLHSYHVVSLYISLNCNRKFRPLV